MPEEDCVSGHRKRLKSRFVKSGLSGFHDYEVIELLLTFAIPRRDVKPLAKELIRKFRSLKGVFEAAQEELAEVKGIGESAALLMTLVRLAAPAYLKDESGQKRPVRSPLDVLDFLDSRKPGPSEEFLAIYMNSKNEILGVEMLHDGAIASPSFSPRNVIEKAFAYNARSVIFVHRRPERKAVPSNAERALSKELEAAASAVDIIVHDHLIVGKGVHFSARENGWLKGP